MLIPRDCHDDGFQIFYIDRVAKKMLVKHISACNV
jgi:hypothetical protein